MLHLRSVENRFSRVENDMESVRLALIQMKCEEQPERNLAKALRMVEEAASRKAQIVCLQELFRSQYFCQREDAKSFELAEPIPGPTTEALSEVAKKRSLVIVAPIFERRAAGVYHNSAVVFDADGSLAGHYRKMHIPEDPCYFEKFYFTPGDLGFPVHRTRYGSIGVLICWDQWFPEAARLVAMAGAQLILYPTAIGWYHDEKERAREKQRNAWQTIQRAHAIANGLYVGAVNRVGVEGELEFWGSSFVADPMGEVIAQASASEDEILIADCVFDKIERVRRNWPFLRDRRIDAYGDLTLRWRG